MLATSSSTSSFSMNCDLMRPLSSCCFLFDSSSVIRLICQPVSSEARRTFWPLRPMATARFPSSTTTSIACFSSSTTIEETSAGGSASRRPDSMIALPRSMRFTVPVTSSSPRDRKSFRICSRSASRMRCRIACFAVGAPMRPNSTFGSRSSMTSSTLASALPLSCASSTESICARFHSGVSSGSTFQRRKVSYAPVFLSTATRTSMSSVYFFLVAEASAISSAPKTMSRGTFFSRARTSTSITSSRFPDITFAAKRSSQFRDEPRTLDVAELELHRPAFQFNVEARAFGAAQHADEPPAPRRIRRAHLHVRLVACETHEVGKLPQRPVKAGRRYLEPLVVHAFDLEHPRELAAHRRAVLDTDAARLVDEETQHPSPVRRLQLDELVPHAGHHRLDHRFQCRHKCAARRVNKKWAEAHLCQAPSKLLKLNRICYLAPLSRRQIARQLERPIAHAPEPPDARAH